MATLTWERKDGQRMVFHLQGLETAIGRELGNPIRIESGYVSKRHAVVRLGQQGYTLADLNSSNGTFINGQRTMLAVLKDGDRIELGSEVLVFSTGAAATRPAAPAPAKKSPVKLVIVGGGAVIVLLLIVLILMGGSAPPAEEPATPAAGTTAAPPDFGGPPPAAAVDAPGGFPPAATDPTGVPPAMAAPPVGPATLPGGEPLPSNDPAALYEMALAHVKGKRYVEARRLLVGAQSLDPGNASVQQRLREVDATVQVLADQHLAAGQRAFQYLRYDDAIFEWEQVMSMVDAADTRYQQAAAGIRRARERLSQKDQ